MVVTVLVKLLRKPTLGPEQDKRMYSRRFDGTNSGSNVLQYLVKCHQGCGEEFVVSAPDRQDSRLVDGVEVGCSNCGERYVFTVDGDGEPSLDSSKGEENITGVDSDRSTHF